MNPGPGQADASDVRVGAPPIKSLLRKAGMLSLRRRDARISCRRAVHLLYGMDAVPAVLTECSLHGIAVLSSVEIPVGERFMIQVNLPSIALLVYTVRHCQPAEHKQFRLGAELVDARVPKGTTLNAVFDALLNPLLEKRAS